MNRHATLIASLYLALTGCSIITSTDIRDLDGPPPAPPPMMMDGGPPPGRLAGNRCEDAIALESGMTYFVQTADYTHVGAADCRIDDGPSPDVFFRLQIDSPLDIDIDTRGSDFDTVVELRRNCQEDVPGFACADNANRTGAARLIQRNLSPGSYIVIVEGQGSRNAGMLKLSYTATSRPPALTCSAPLDISGGATVFDSSISGLSELQPPFSCISPLFRTREEQVFVFDVDVPSRVDASTEGTVNVDTVLSLSSGGCPGGGRPTLACNDDVERGMNHSRLESRLAPARYYLVLDTIDSSGPYVLTFQIDPN